MRDMKRYELLEDEDGEGCMNILGMAEIEGGEWVKHEDAVATEKRLAEATACLHQVWRERHALPSSVVEEVRACLLSTTSSPPAEPTHDAWGNETPTHMRAHSPPAEPAQSLVEQIEDAIMQWDNGVTSLNTVWRVRDILRAAREAGGR